MRFYTLSPNVPENPVLFPTMRPTFIPKGHVFVDRIEDCDCVLMDLHTRIADYRQVDIDFIIQNKPPVVTFDEWDRGGMSLEFWPNPLTKQMEDILELSFSYRVKSAHFCRLLDKTKKYYANVYPYEKPIEYEEPLLTPEELFNRPIDITYIANDAPSRQLIKKAFEEDGRLKCNIILGAEKLPFDKWVNEYRKSKFFIAASGGGYSCEKKQNLFSICAILQERTDQLLLHPFEHGVNCLKFDQPPSASDIGLIYRICNEKENLYKIYKNGYDFMKTYYSESYIANEILEKILKHCA